MSFPTYERYKDSGVEWLGEIPEHWGMLSLKNVAKVDNSGCYGKEPESGANLLPVATTAQISAHGRFLIDKMPLRSFADQELARYLCVPGDILVVKSSGSAENVISGKAGLFDESTPPFIFSNFLLRARPNRQRVNPKFLYALLTCHLGGAAK
ncbi:MAG: hypothetical protein ACRD22_18975 [Terriglobia bacterium]